LKRAVSAIHDKAIDFLAREFRKRLGHHAGGFGLHMEHVRVTAQEAQHTADLFLALTRSKIIDDADSQIVSDLFRERNSRLCSGCVHHTRAVLARAGDDRNRRNDSP
jgi:hypothetical protein